MKLVSLKRSCIALSVLAVCAGSLTACKHKHKSGSNPEYKVQVVVTADNSNMPTSQMTLAYTQGGKNYSDHSATIGTFDKTYSFADNNTFILSSISYSSNDYTCKLNQPKLATPSSPAVQIVVGSGDWTCTSTKSLAHETIKIVDENDHDMTNASVKLTSSAGYVTASDNATVDLTPGTYASDRNITVDGINYSFQSSDPTTLTATGGEANTWTLTYKKGKGPGPVSNQINLNVKFSSVNATSYAQAYASIQDNSSQATLTDATDSSTTYDFSNFVASKDGSVTASAKSITQSDDKFSFTDGYKAPSGCTVSTSGAPASVGDTITETFTCSAKPPAPRAPVNPTGDGKNKFVVYAMTKDIVALTSDTLTSDQKSSHEMALFPASYSASSDNAAINKLCDNNENDAETANSLYCKLYDTSKKSPKMDVELQIAFEKPHTGRQASADGKSFGTLDSNFSTKFSKDSISSLPIAKFNEETGFSFGGVTTANVITFIADLQTNPNMYVFNSVGGWDYSNPLVPASSGDTNFGKACTGLKDVYHEGLMSDSLDNSRKYAEAVYSSSGQTPAAGNMDYSKDTGASCTTMLNHFDYFPNPTKFDGKDFISAKASSTPNPEGLGDDKTSNLAMQYINNWVTLAKAMGVAGIDVDYEETWLGDLDATIWPAPGAQSDYNFASLPTNQSYYSARSFEKYAGIFKVLQDARVGGQGNDKLALSMATVPVATAEIDDKDGAEGNNWFLGNLKGLAYMAEKYAANKSAIDTEFAAMDHIGVMTYDADTNKVSSYCPSSGGMGYTGNSQLCSLPDQIDNYVAGWKSWGKTGQTPVFGGIELGTPAYPNAWIEGKETDANCMIPLKNSNKGTCSVADAPATVSDLISHTLVAQKGVIVWDIVKEYGSGAPINSDSQSGSNTQLDDGNNVADYGDLVNEITS